MTKDEIRDIAAHIIVDAAFYGRACKLRAEGETVDCAKALEHVNLGVRRMEDELARLRAENERLRATAGEAISIMESLNVIFLPDHFETKQVVTETIAALRAAMAQGKV